MNYQNYEHHTHSDPDFPIVMHLDTNQPTIHSFYLHWHEHLEMLYFTRGHAIITIDAVQVNAKEGDVVVINSNHVHTLFAGDEGCSYHCLIVGKPFCDTFAISVEELRFNDLVCDEYVSNLFEQIAIEMRGGDCYYKQRVKGLILDLLVTLSRKHISLPTPAPRTDSKQLGLVKNAISYIGQHYREHITVDDICSHIGYTKYYFCRTFKAVTGKTVVEYINIMRCNHAWRLISSGEHNVSESAMQSGFTNLPYFTKTYRRLLGRYPSDR